MSKKAEETGGPEDVDAAFAAIVAGLQREGVSGDWPDGEREERKAEKQAEKADAPEPEPEPGAHPGDHFVPPDPPPLPPLRPATLGALALFCLGALLLIAPNVLGLAASTGTPLALLAISCGIGWLVLRMRKGPPPDSGWDDGAQV
ncbi:hypothetical protein [Allokutzneria albata]|uniref:DUF308 domain-containing protein n=1 Tax=Allokutzneria albata TaxID=211114 RepID=A0A1H0CR72_ALLAB|nr:hypothetical protein [Allokutzneria albata]SDN60358.1 hypothetical protein SAMN04489726_7374 [Allokutzneria albata]